MIAGAIGPRAWTSKPSMIRHSPQRIKIPIWKVLMLLLSRTSEISIDLDIKIATKGTKTWGNQGSDPSSRSSGTRGLTPGSPFFCAFCGYSPFYGLYGFDADFTISFNV